jgi:hypothetical protein
MTRPTLALSLAMFFQASSASADALDDLARAVEKFRGLGHEDVRSYRVELRIPEEGEESVPLEEIWREPGDLVLRAALTGTPVAIVRSLALYLEPIYVARASLLDADLGAHVERLRKSATVEAVPEATGTRVVVRFPEDPKAAGLEALEDVAVLSAELDRHSRLRRLDIRLREEKEPLILECEFRGGAERPQPDVALWTLPNGDRVEIRTEFRDQSGRSVPASRLVLFPSRYDPGEREEILVRYGVYSINVEIPADVFEDPGSFHYDAEGLVTD